MDPPAPPAPPATTAPPFTTAAATDADADPATVKETASAADHPAGSPNVAEATALGDSVDAEPAISEEAAAATASDNDTDASPTPAVDFDVLLPKIEAAIFTSDRALSAGKLAEALGLAAGKLVIDGIDRLNRVYADTGRAFRIEAVAGGYRVLTLPEHADVLAALHKTKGQSKLSAAALETLAIVAYKQPVLRAELESIRGVACGETLRSLLERHLIKIVGRAEEIGRPMLYGTTKHFLELFGLATLKDLPKVEDLQPRVADAR